ncbi:fimbrial protein [Serratia proteamaculans]|uniref:Fimbrial protein n=1 Tax=Serratia proteamaculans TaxID=28151 RepID=A0A5Q2VD81_SERPR|nr:fimbrial protein [Serratia proteamaculans]QGH61989.1 fimbrial protein [Serratia proteamaculans]
MKKTLIAMGMIMTACAAYSSATLAAADGTGTIKFTGTITDSTCVVTAGDGTTPNFDIKMGTIAKADLSGGVGRTAGAHSLIVNLSECPADLTKASVRFAGENDLVDTKMLSLTQDEGVATGVAIQFTDEKYTPLVLGQTPTNSIAIVEGKASLPYYARYIATKDTVTSGPANSTASYTVVYN